MTKTYAFALMKSVLNPKFYVSSDPNFSFNPVFTDKKIPKFCKIDALIF